MKKIIPLLLAAMLLGGCGSGSEEHTHSPLEGWERNATAHWKVCECGVALEEAGHQLVNGVCSQCGSEIWDTGDGIMITDYDESGAASRITCYDVDGNLVSDTSHVYEHYDNGLLRREEVWERGFMVQEMEFDENVNLVLYRFYEEGTGLVNESSYEYAQDGDGNWYQLRGLDREVVTGITYAYEYNVQGDIVSRVKYDADNNVEYVEQYEREYNEENRPLWEKTYINGVLTEEITGYMTVTDEYGWMRFPEEIIEYYEDGAKLVSRYGDNGEVATEQYVLPDGTLGRNLRYEYQTDADGNWNYIRVYDGERLTTESRYETDENGWNYRATLINYRADGSKTVYHYDESETLIEEIEYDTTGERIP